MRWTVNFNHKAVKQTKKLNRKILSVLSLLIEDLAEKGPFPGKQWPNYSKLKGLKRDARHCHLIKGQPTYVCCWEVLSKKEFILEVYYVGTHEKAPY